MLRKFTADLHIHTCLSPCAELEITPSAIVRAASGLGMNIVAITDHNSAENVPAAKHASAGTGITVLAGMEITSEEEAHILGIFDEAGSSMKLQETVYGSLQPGENDEKLFGEQIIVNEKDEVLGFSRRLLIGATSLSARKIVDTIHSLGGLAIASHIDRDAFGIISQLGFIPADLMFDALEISPRTARHDAESLFSAYRSFPWITSSDAHDLSDIGKRTTTFYIHEPTVREMRLALQNIDGRKVEWGPNIADSGR